jgi:serine protease AprX
VSSYRRPVAIVAAALSASVVTGMAAAPAFAANPTRPAPEVTAVVSLTSAREATVPGLRVLAVLRHIDAEVVRGTPAQLAALSRTAGVAGVAGDARMIVAGTATSTGPGSPGRSVYAAEGLGGGAGDPAAGRGVNVAVLDTGLTDTPALSRSSGRVTDGVDVSNLFNGGDARTSGQFTDGYGHGTFVSSLIAGGAVPGTNGRALGVAPGARVVVVKVADDNGVTSLSEVLAGLDWVAAHARAIKVVNLALAQVRPTAPQYGADPLTAGIEHVAASGVLPVVAVGNTPGQVSTPGDDLDALTVGSADTANGVPGVASFSGYGNVDGVNKPDLVAPGVHVLGEMPADSVIAKDNPQGWQPDGLFRGSGSSMATAIESGIAAIFFSRNPQATVLQAKASLRAAAAPLVAKPTAAGAGLAKVPDQALSGQAVTRWANQSGFNSAEWTADAFLNDAWAQWLGQAWSSSAWDASTWSASTWSASTWSASTWSASTWSASTWSASTWSASTWSASTWSASTWSSSTWSASTWSAQSWGR